MWSLISTDDQYKLSDRACRSNTTKTLCLRGFYQANLRERLIKSNISEHLDEFISNEIHPIKTITRYHPDQRALTVKEIVVQAKSKWGFKWDISGDPEFRLSIRGAKSQLIYRAHLIPSRVQIGDELRLKPDPKRTLVDLVDQAELSNLTLKLEELDPISSDLVLERKIKIEGQAKLIVQSDLTRFIVEKINGDSVYQEALQTLNKPHPITFYQED